jgi:dihydroxyacetone kinase-like predicted kinase
MIPLPQFKLEFTLHAYGTTAEGIRNALAEFAEAVVIALIPGDTPQGEDYQVSLTTEEPQLVFDACAQFGRIRSIKIEEGKGNG